MIPIMEQRNKKISGLFLLVCLAVNLTGCGQTQEEVTSSFLEGDPQDVLERAVHDTLVVSDSLLIAEEYGILDAAGLRMVGDEHYIKDSANRELCVIDKESLELILNQLELFGDRFISG
jgi:hypothetical protein